MFKDQRVKNSIWMASEKLLQIAGVFIVTAAMAKYIGPYYYGAISYLTSAFSLIYIISALGADPIVIKKGSVSVKYGTHRSVSISIIKTIVYLLLSLAFLFFYFYRNGVRDLIIVSFLVSIFLSQLFSCIDFLSLVNNFLLKSKINTIANVIGLSIALVLRYLFVHYNFDVIYFCIPIVVSPLISFLIKLKYSGFSYDKSLLRKYFKFNNVNALISTLRPFAITNISANIYLKIPLISVSLILGYKYAGVFSCAVTIATTWVFFPMAIISSFIPKFYRLNKSQGEDYLSSIILLMILGCLVVMLVIGFLSKYLIFYLYGESYYSANELVIYMSACSSLSVLGTLLYHYLIKDKAYGYIMKRTFFCAVISIPLTVVLTYYYGMKGAVISLLFVEFFSIVICNLFYKNSVLLKIVIGSFSIKKIKRIGCL